MNDQLKRVGWIEVLRAVAMLMVVVPHFIASFCPEVFVYWQTHSLFLKGISGKHGVAIFCVLLGYFSSKYSSASFPTYCVRRYLQFAINICIVLLPFSVITSILSRAQILVALKDLLNAVLESVLFGSSLNPTLWCVRSMFFGSLICFVLGNYCKMENKRKEMAFIFVVCFFLYFVDMWLAMCVLGAGLRVCMEIKVSDRWKLVLCILFVVAIPFLYRHEESRKTIMMQGLSCCLFMYVCDSVSSTTFKKSKLKLHLLPFVGSISFYLFLWHTPINMVLKLLDLGWSSWELFGLSLSLTLALSVIQYWMNRKWITPMYKRIQIDTVVNTP